MHWFPWAALAWDTTDQNHGLSKWVQKLGTAETYLYKPMVISCCFLIACQRVEASVCVCVWIASLRAWELALSLVTWQILVTNRKKTLFISYMTWHLNNESSLRTGIIIPIQKPNHLTCLALLLKIGRFPCIRWGCTNYKGYNSLWKSIEDCCSRNF